MKGNDITVFIPGNVPSLKNGKIKIKGSMTFSKSVRKYLRSLGIRHYSMRQKITDKNGKKRIIAEPIVYEYKTTMNMFPTYFPEKEVVRMHKIFLFHFIRDTNRKFDFVNIVQIIADLMTAHGFIEDDNMDFFIPFPLQINGNYYSVDKKNPGVLIVMK